ncbi:hypothetical protein [Hydrogenophaga sp. RWCD_12]|uniref:hypothetical protein n=1 Tax=Hydrogenophaga sp. RWCD_12 TaxID=3391190 RepID=UPI003984AD3F
MIPAVPSQLLLLAIVYALLAFLLLVLCLGTRWRWSLKVALVLVVSGFYMFSWQSLRGMSGWPADDELPAKFILLAAVFDEPSPGRGHPGAIYLWVNPMKDNQPLEMPRQFKLPYEKDLHRILGDGVKKARDGNTQLGETEPRRGQGGLAWLRPAANDKVEIKLRDLPRAQLPEK